MTNNDLLRRLRYALNITDCKVAEIVTKAGRKTQPEEVANWLKWEDEPGYIDLPDRLLCQFLDGLIVEKRGPHPSGNLPDPLEVLSNNEVLKKLRIALHLQADDMIAVFKKVEFDVSKAELGSFFRKPGHRNYAKCPEQVLRKFLAGLSK